MYSTYQFAPKRSSVSQFNRVVENELYAHPKIGLHSMLYETTAPALLIAVSLLVTQPLGEKSNTLSVWSPCRKLRLLNTPTPP
jgi:hypothetical protein